jgi:hypothetical protein
MTRGKIYNRDRAQQIKDFSGLRWGKITPTDVDGLIEYKDKGFIWIETKMIDNPMPYGQRLAYKRLIDALQQAKPSVLYVSQHNTMPEDDIDMAQTEVIEYYFMGRWSPCDQDITLFEAIDGFINKHLEGV